MAKRIIVFLLICVVGCGYTGGKKEMLLSNKVEVSRTNRILKDKKKVQLVEKDLTKSKKKDVLENKYAVKMQGKLSIDGIVKIVSDVLGMTMSGYVESDVVEVLDVDIDSKLTKKELLYLLSETISKVGYAIRYDGNVIVLEKIDAGKVGGKYVKYMEMEYLANKIDSVVNNVVVRCIGDGVLLLGEKLEVLSTVDVIKEIDKDVFENYNVVMIPCNKEVSIKLDEMLKYMETIKYLLLPVGDDYTILLIRGKNYIKRVMEIVDMLLVGVGGDLYTVKMKSVSTEEIKRLIKEVYPNLKYTIYEQYIVMNNFSDKEKIRKLLNVVDYAERKLLVRMYIIDMQIRDTRNMGYDIIFDNGQFNISSSLRDKVGLFAMGSYKDFKLMLNYLVQNYDGKVLTSPTMVIKNNTESSLNFGQSIPTLKSKQESTGGGSLVQNIEYVRVGLGVNVKINVVGDVVYSDMTVNNSSVMENVGVEGNPQFSSDDIKLSLVGNLGEVSMIAGLKRIAKEQNKRVTLLPQSLFNKKESREFMLCLLVEEIDNEKNTREIINNFENSLDK